MLKPSARKIHAALQKIGIQVASHVRQAKTLRKGLEGNPVQELLDRYHITTDATRLEDGQIPSVVVQIVLDMLDQLADAGPAIRSAIESPALLTLRLHPGEHIELPNVDDAGCHPSNAFADYERDQAMLTIATDMNMYTSEVPKVGSGEHNVGKTFRTVLSHELGHLVQDHVEQAAGLKFVHVYDSQPKEYWQHEVSEYAGKNDRELFAECFAAYTSNKYRGDLPQDVVSYFEKAGVVPQVRKAGRRRPTADDAIESADWSTLTDAITDDMRAAYEQAFKAEGINAETDLDFDTASSDALAYAEDRAAELVTDISNTTRNRLRSTIVDAIDSGLTNAQLAQQIQDDYAFSEERSMTIARTELAMADSAGHQAAASAAGAVGKRWLLSNDDPCDDCAGNADDDVIAFDDIFSSGDDFPTAHPNCCCDFQAIYADDPDAEDLIDDEEDTDKVAKIHHPRAVRSGRKWKVKDTDGHVYGTHGSKASADRQVAALYANKLEKVQVDAQAHAAATSPLNYKPQPTDGQIRAGNYSMGHVKMAGLDITIENPAGSTRRYKHTDGSTKVAELTHHYGYIKRTTGADGDHVDILVRQGMDTDNYSGPIFIVDQYIDGKFDEHKCLIGWTIESAARQAYMDQYQPNWKGLGSISMLSQQEFKEWLKDGDMTKPYSTPKSAEGK